MGLDVLERENHVQAGPRSRTVHQPPRSREKVDENDVKALLKRRYNNLRRLDGNYRELRLSNSTSPRRKSMPARTNVVNAKNSEVVKRGSVYQSSIDVRSMMRLTDGRRNEKPALSDESFLSFDIVDPLAKCSSNKAIGCPQPKRSPLMSLDTASTSPSIDSHHSVAVNSSEFLELSFRDLPEARIKLGSSCSASVPVMDSSTDTSIEFGLHLKDTKGKGSVEEEKFDTEETVGNVLSERDTLFNLPKSFSAKAIMLNSSHNSEKATSKSSPKSRFSPFKKILDPIMKSKSLRNPSRIEAEIGGSAAVNPPSIKRHRVLRKSLLNDFSNATEKLDTDDRDQVSMLFSSPAHLHATLRLDSKHGAPSYEFAVKDLEDVLLAKTWRTDSAFNWVYTFHSCTKRSATSSRWGSKERHGQSPPMVGQMQVSCYLCSEVSDSGSLEISTVTEFVLYDIAQLRRSFAIEEVSHCTSDSTQHPNFTIGDSIITECHSATSNSSENEKYPCRRRHPSSDFDSDPSTAYPLASSNLHPYLEMDAVVIRIPFDKKERKDLNVERDRSAKEHRNLSNDLATDVRNDTTFECMNRANVKVVIPSGRHGLPSTEEGSPLSLLDKWRFGGGCDCGGWDMACPIDVLDNHCAANDVADHSTNGCQQQMVLFVQGKKEKIPALSIIADGKGQYTVHFHAQLSSIQAFSICISILHSSEAASALGNDRKQRLYSNSLKLLLEEEVRHLIEAVAEEERRISKKKAEHPSPSFILDPPFSPMGRV